MGTRSISYIQLNKHELSYEVLIRGGEPDCTVLELRKQINKLIPLYPAEDITESGIDFETDIDGVNSSIKELNTRVTSLETKYELNLYKRTTTLSTHIYYRLKRIGQNLNKPSAIEVQLSNESNKEYNAILARLNNFPPLNVLNNSTSEHNNSASEHTNVQSHSSFDGPTIVSASCERGHINELQKLKYNGKTCVRSFLQKVEEFREARNISPTKLYTYATEIFTDDALIWYRSVKNEVYDWNELSTLLKKDFGQFDYDYKLMSEIRSRTQGESENITIYLAMMSELFSRLSKTLSESDKLEILLHNIRPCYANVLASTSSGITSIDTLRKLCRNFENIQCLSSQYREPPRMTSEMLAPDLAYTKRDQSDQHKSKNNFYKNYNSSATNQRYSNYNNYNKNYNQNKQSANYNSYPKNSYSEKHTTTPVSNKPQSQAVATIDNGTVLHKVSFCPRCRSNDHTLHQCKQDRFVICFKCGKKDVKYPVCPICNPKPNPKN